MALKILTVLAGAKVGGAEEFFVSLTTAMKRAEFDVRSVIKPNAARETALAKADIGFDTAPFGGLFDFATGRTMRRAAAAFAPDCVLAFAGRAASFTPKGDYALIGRLGGYYNLKNFRSCDHLVCNAPDLVRHCIEGGFAKERVHLIPNFPSVPELPALDRTSFGTPKGVKLAVAMGRFHPNKALDVLLRATALIPDLHVWIAGDGPEEAKLKALARDLGVAPRVRFLGWRSDRAALLHAADVLVYPSREEPFGNVVVEAWSCGTPVVTAASTGPKWLVRDGEDAILIPIDDAPALADGIRNVLGSKELAQRLTAAGRKRIETEFSEAAILGRYAELFESVAR